MMKANVLKAVNDLQYIDWPEPQIPEGWVLLNVKAAGICGSDVARVFTNGTYHFPTIIGHEFAGRVAKVNKGDEALLGMRCSVFPLIPCMECDSCKEGRYETCAHYNYLGSRCDGGFAEYVAVPKWNLLPISDNTSMSSAAMFEPASVGLHALRKVGLNIGDTLAIVGPGTIGCILAQLARIGGAKRIIMIGRSQEKLDFAANMFGVDIINSTKQDVESEINALTGGKGVDVAVEGTGASGSMNICLDLAKPAGRVLAMGNPLADMNLAKASYWKILRKQLTLYGTWNSAYGTAHGDWECVRDMVAQGQLQLEKLITHTFPLSGLIDGLNVMRDHDTYSNKVMIINE